MLANECKLGDKIKILNPGDGAYDCIRKIGYITDKENTDGKLKTNPGINVELENGQVWRIDPEAKVERLDKAYPTSTTPNKARESVDLDPIKPSYYNDTKITPFNVIVIDDWSLNFYLGNATKYIERAGKKDGNSRLQDLKKLENISSMRLKQRRLNND